MTDRSTSLPTPFLTELEDDTSLGGKARSLARLRAEGLPTPDGFVVTDALFRALLTGPLGRDTERVRQAPFPAGFAQALAARLAALAPPGARFSVRSSFALEDEPGSVAAGVYESRTDVSADEVPAALRAVLASALGPGAGAYAEARGERPARPPVAVLIHRYLTAEASGGGAWDPGRPERAPLIDVQHGRLNLGATETIRRSLENLATRFGPVEIEWAATGDQVTFLQLRPYASPEPPPPWRGWHELDDGTAPEAWHWDAAHNPLPLSRAHTGLVAAVDERCRIGIRQRVLGGYLFWSPDGPQSPDRLEPDELPEALARLTEDVDQYLVSLQGPPSIEAALAGFLPLYERLFGVLQPAARAARAALVDLLRGERPQALALLPVLLSGVRSRAQLRLALARRLSAARDPRQRRQALDEYLAMFGDEAAAWDIAAPTYRERPQELQGSLGPPAGGPEPPATHGSWQEAAAGVRAQLVPAAAERFDQALAAARAAVVAGEDDDWLYARLQTPLRQAVLSLGDRLVAAGALVDPTDAFHLHLHWLRSYSAGRPLPGDVRRMAAEGRLAQREARAHPPPLAAPRIRGLAPRGSSPDPSAPVLRGTGTSGRTVGRVVHRHGPSGAVPPSDAVLVATTLLPTELPLIHAAALVCETGGPLDHVATQARERGLPAVVGVVGAVAALAEGDTVVVDADAGLVVRASR
jgi:phosphohistidine swiveling domain-containing protein